MQLWESLPVGVSQGRGVWLSTKVYCKPKKPRRDGRPPLSDRGPWLFRDYLPESPFPTHYTMAVCTASIYEDKPWVTSKGGDCNWWNRFDLAFDPYPSVSCSIYHNFLCKWFHSELILINGMMAVTSWPSNPMASFLPHCARQIRAASATLTPGANRHELHVCQYFGGTKPRPLNKSSYSDDSTGCAVVKCWRLKYGKTS